MWYFKGRRKKYKSPYTGKEVDAAVGLVNSLDSTPEGIDVATEFVGRMGVTPENVEEAAEDVVSTVEKVEGYPNPIPADVGKVFTIDSNGGVILDTPSSGGAVYCHRIKTGTSLYDPTIVIYSSSNTPFTAVSLAKGLKAAGYDSNSNGIQISAIGFGNIATAEAGTTKVMILTRLWCASTQNLTADKYELTFTLTNGVHQLTSITQNNGYRPSVINDTVSEIVPVS